MNAVPSPIRLSARTVPPWASTMTRTSRGRVRDRRSSRGHAALVALEERPELLGRDADAVVPHGDDRGSVPGPDAHLDPLTGPELDRVLQEIAHRLVDPPAIPDADHRRRRLHADARSGLPGAHRQAPRDLPDRRREVEAFSLAASGARRSATRRESARSGDRGARPAGRRFSRAGGWTPRPRRLPFPPAGGSPRPTCAAR